ncbi:DUF3099 domain-containing protein [Catellatospora citrea]|uniref:DUF3099 family protein n=1 Tax=Catellatospora citrea TaxID=53366 RepID=A0A8J3P146_9ACTN|nr:DUF3099 domain-containing protein [Catellatospora citrea]RKE10090.1 hypothetical protein C8E86_4984 [Catellatospora citrea]GIF98000.1 hypothetical protein Cci01nite_30940 [Catellatospora citrea]
MKRQADRPALITDAAESPEVELRRRERRYIAMMLLRAGCLILGSALAMLQVPLLWLWLPLCGLGMVLLPWLAVILANDRPPKDEHRFKRYRRQTIPTNALPAQPAGPVYEGTIDDAPTTADPDHPSERNS